MYFLSSWKLHAWLNLQNWGSVEDWDKMGFLSYDFCMEGSFLAYDLGIITACLLSIMPCTQLEVE